MFWNFGPPQALEPPKNTTPSTEGLSGIFDQKCPACGVLGAYIGFQTVECHNTHCPHWNARWHKDYQVLVQDALNKKKAREEKIQAEAKSVLEDELGLSWDDEKEGNTKDMDLSGFFAYPPAP